MSCQVSSGRGGAKKSKRGLMTLARQADGKYITKDQVGDAEEETGELREVFRDGKCILQYTLDEVRANLSRAAA